MEQADEEEGEKLQRRFQAGSGASDGRAGYDHRRSGQELGVRRKLLYQWRDQFQAEGRAGLERRRGRPPGSKSQTVSQPPSAAELRIAELERLLGRKQLEVDFLKRAFEQVRGAASNRTSDGGKESIAASKSRSRSKE
jgi:transposase